MRFHECIELTLLLLLICSWKTSLLLPLIIHHFLDNTTRVSIQVRKLGVLRFDLLGVDLFVAYDDLIPPVLSILFGERDLKLALARAQRLEAPD